MKGDLDCNKLVELADAVMLAKAIGGVDVNLSVEGRQNAEIDATEGIGSGDLTKLLQYLAGLLEKL